MTSFRDNLHKPFQEQNERLVKPRRDAHFEKDDLAVERAALPELRAQCEQELVPIFEKWNKDLAAEVKPFKEIKKLKRKVTGLRGLMRLTWFNGKAMKTRVLNFLLRAGIALVFLLKLAFVVGLVYATIKLAEWIGAAF